MLRPGTLELKMMMDESHLVDFKMEFPILTPRWNQNLAEFHIKLLGKYRNS